MYSNSGYTLFIILPVGGIKLAEKMYKKKLHISKIFSNLVAPNIKFVYLVMCNLYTKFVKFLEICKQFSEDLVTESGNMLRPGPVPRFSDLEVIALSMAAESEEIDSENWLFESKLKECPPPFPTLSHAVSSMTAGNR